jgi:hypothetical protein
MAGQIYAPGNAYLDNAEFNWWFDPDATQVVLRAAVPHFIIPLDCTNHIPLTKEVCEQVAQHQPQTIITQLYAQAYAPFFGSGPAPTLSTFGTLTKHVSPAPCESPGGAPNAAIVQLTGQQLLQMV